MWIPPPVKCTSCRGEHDDPHWVSNCCPEGRAAIWFKRKQPYLYSLMGWYIFGTIYTEFCPWCKELILEPPLH